MAGNDTLINAIGVICTAMKNKICENVSFHPQADFVEISNERKDKFPAIIVRGPQIDEDLLFRIEDPKIVFELQYGRYIKTPTPVVCDVYFNVIILCESDIEGLQTLSKVISFFKSMPQITVKDSPNDTKGKIYNVILKGSLSESRTANISDIVRYETKFLIEGIEFSSGEDTIGKIAKEVNLNINSK
ncbi:MAG: hypothetical protein K0Q47_5 [Sedimentibacter sp.]|jgi:hypothetical protein|nr:hypothetical protein [Sedimentibacter sp.]